MIGCPAGRVRPAPGRLRLCSSLSLMVSVSSLHHIHRPYISAIEILIDRPRLHPLLTRTVRPPLPALVFLPLSPISRLIPSRLVLSHPLLCLPLSLSLSLANLDPHKILSLTHLTPSHPFRPQDPALIGRNISHSPSNGHRPISTSMPTFTSR
ncbi:hypothetical protein BDN70DRAFT_439676 [Pholiota conissans]|uniref:Uncharacterized protein n=1 Tax=Pholiota conissans TaxID=109636 RepID=A0A9P5YPL1_9AGAR|nr:hypothetical protein BDN70DRAFT_439676 [Pholiota conissans]